MRSAVPFTLVDDVCSVRWWVRNVWILERKGLSERAVMGSWRHLFRCCVAVGGNFLEEKELAWLLHSLVNLALEFARISRIRFTSRGLVCFLLVNIYGKRPVRTASVAQSMGAVIHASCCALCACVELHSIAERAPEKQWKWGRGIGETQETPPRRAGNDRSDLSKWVCASFGFVPR